ncbi:MAG: sulfurtransferase [Piscinibacter sp.]|uniref:sulfurtransferase n=1 Tax=Piscinibacter sp. TaxID=1903157 RepID=UPI0025875839|nr:sulfurtransferase [Piscinibacter sp.]MCW5662611.1 sulfurtransferase [Piscinibacter sp.]
MAFTTLISADDLRALRERGADAVVVDCGFDLADPEDGEHAWAAAHLPGAFYLHLDRDLSGPKTGRNGRHPLPAREAFAATLGRLGIGAQTQVVPYDRQGGPYAARLWWMLRWMGHEAAAVLDGGLQAWRAAGGPVDAEPPATRHAAPYPTRASLAPTLETDALGAQLGRVPLVDARAAERFRGEVEPLDPVAGHIPGALHRFFKDNLGPDGRFKPAATLRAEFESLLGREAASATVHQCGSGVTACHNLLAMEHAGLPGSRLYPGSWSEWCADPTRPVARG